MSFFKTGYDNLDAIEQKMEARQAAGGKTWRFRMKTGETKRVIFLDDNPPVIEEHQLKIDGNWGNFFTCLKNLGQPCPLCEAGDKPATTGFYTVIDRTEFTIKNGDKAGQKRRDQIRVLAAKFKGLKQFKKFSAKYAGLVGVEFEVERTSDKSASIGDQYIKEEKYSASDLLAIVNASRVAGGQQAVGNIGEVATDWEKYLEPKTAAELTRVAGGKANELDDDSRVDFE